MSALYYSWFKLKGIYTDVFPCKAEYLPDQYPDLTGKVALVSGANTGVGYRVAKLLASKNCTVILTCRSLEKAEKAIMSIQLELKEESSSSIGSLDYVTLDLSDLTTLKAAAEAVNTKTDKLNIIIHNAGVMIPPPGSKTVQGFDLQLGTNVLGTFAWQKLLDPLFLSCTATDKRIVWVTSSAHSYAPPNGGIQWDDINFEKNPTEVEVAYGQSKVGDIYLSHMWRVQNSEQVLKQNIISVAAHPGLLKTELTRHIDNKIQMTVLGWMQHPPIFGAYTELFAALNASITVKDNGRFIGPWGKFTEMRFDVEEGLTNGTAEKLWLFAETQTLLFTN